MAKTEPLSFFVKLDGPSGPMCGADSFGADSSGADNKVSKALFTHSFLRSGPKN